MKRMSIWTATAVVCVVVTGWAATALSQAMTKTVTMNAGDIKGQPYSLEELGALVAHVGDEFKVLIVTDPLQRTKNYQNVDLRAEDRILMVNGKKLTSIEQLKSVIDSVAIGGNIQLGIRRGKDMKVVGYAKADPKTLPKVERKFVTHEVGPGGPKTTEQTFTSSGETGETVAVMKGAGVIVRQAEGHLEVMHVMPEGASIEVLKDLKAGDLVLSLQGKKAETLDGLEATWNSLATGDPVKLVCSRAGVEHTYAFAKPDASKSPGGAMIITK